MSTASDRQAPRAGASAFPAGAAGLSWDPVPWDGAARMAADRTAFGRAEVAARAGDAPAARLAWWTWREPTISLGFLEPASGVRAPGMPVVRRPTGGGAILHAAEWTWSALVPRDHPRLGGTLDRATRALTGVVAAALREAYGIVVDPARAADATGGACEAPRGTACFARRLGYELAVGGRKLMGSAQRRGRHVLLQQGSLLVGPGHERLARHLAAGPAAEAALAGAAVTLGELLGHAPDPAPFRAALAAAWAEAASGLGEAHGGVLDRAAGRS